MLAHPNANSSSSTLSDAPVPSSSSSSTTRSILRSSPSTLNIRFAPLPDIPQRKRRSSAPLGVAHRASMMRRQQMRREGGSSWDDNQNNHYQPNSRTYVNGDGSSVTVNYETGKRSGQQDEDEDPLMILGRLVKDATKQLWRKVSTPSIPPPAPLAEPSEKVQPSSSPPSRDVVIATKSQEELDRSNNKTTGGGVWEVQVDERLIPAAARQSDVDPLPKIDIPRTSSTADNNRPVPFPSPDSIDTQIPLDSSLMEQTASLDITDKDEDALPSPSSSHTARQHPMNHSPPPPSPSPTSPTSLTSPDPQH